MAIFLTKDNFEKEVMKSDLPVMVDFFATWCGPCQMLAPIFEELGKEMTKKVKFVKINIDEENELADRFGVRSIPTLIMFNNGEEIDRMLGFMPKDALKAQINSMLGSAKK